MQSFLKDFKDSDIEGDVTEGGNIQTLSIKTLTPLKEKRSNSKNISASKQNKL